MESTAQLETVDTRTEAGVATLTLNRPQALNACSKQLTDDLRTAFDAAAADDEVRVVVLTGAGRAFSTGADLADTANTPIKDDRPDLEQVLHDRYHHLIEDFRTCPKPMVAAVNGPCAGVGMSFALACDLVVAARSAYFLQAFVNIGLVPDGGASALMASRIGFTRAMELAMLGERLPAERALEWGLVNRVVEDDALQDEVGALAAKLAAGPTLAYAGVKRQLNAWSLATLTEQLALEASVQGEMARTDDFAEGALAFLQKRPASFKGA